MSIPSESPGLALPPPMPPALLGVAVALCLWALDLLGLLHPLQGRTYDAFLWLACRAPSNPPQVLVVEWDSGLLNAGGARMEDEEVLKRTLTALEGLGACQIVLASLPEGTLARMYPELAAREKVIVGVLAVTDPDDPLTGRLAGVPKESLSSRTGVVLLPPTADGVYRQQRAWVSVGPNRYPALEMAAARHQLAPSRLPDHDYRVYFRGGPGSLPHVSLDVVLAGGLVRELVEGRTVLLGRVAEAPAPGLFTPTAGGQQMSWLEFQGQALDTLLSGRAITPLRPLPRLLLLVLTSASCALLYQWLQARTAFWVSLLILAGLALIAAGLLAFGHVWLPVAELGLAQALCLIFVFRSKATRSHHHARRCLRDLVSGVRAEALPAGFHEAAAPWELLVSFVRQTLDVHRLAFLEAIEGARRLRETACFPGPTADIYERRRDYTRPPYNGALETGRPVRVDTSPRPFFTPTDLPEHQYLAPLVFAGKVLGFWALAIDPVKAEAVGRLEVVLGELSGQMAELLSRRQQLAAAQSRPSPLWDFLTLTSEEAGYRALRHNVVLLERRLNRKEQLFADSSIPTIAYDLFGRVREVNAAMLEFLAAESLDPNRLTAVEVVSALTNEGPERSRRCLRHVILDRGRLALPVQTERHAGHYLLSLSPLRAGPQDAGSLPLCGICCELLDRTSVTQLARIKDQLTGEVAVLMRNDLGAIELSASLLAEADLPPAEREEMAGIVSDKVNRVLDTLATCQQYLALDVPGERDRIPVDARPLFRRALQSVGSLLGAHGVKVEVREPDLLSYALASPEHLRQVFEDVLTLLIHDARHDSRITVEVRETDEHVAYSFTSDGCGLPNDRFQEYLHGNGAVTLEEYRRLRNGVRWVAGWGGRVEAVSRPGEGICVAMLLPRFH